MSKIHSETILFTYGSLMPPFSPPQSMTHFWVDAISGVLFDLGEWPAALNISSFSLDQETIPGITMIIRTSELSSLDSFEDVEKGLFTRKNLITKKGYEAWAYEFSQPLPESAKKVAKWPS